MSYNNTCICGVQTNVLTSTFTLLNNPNIAENASQVISLQQCQTEYVYVSTIQGTLPNYKYQYKSQTERIQAKLGRLSLNNC